MGMMDVFNIICGICSVAGLFVSIFTASKVIKVTQTLNSGNLDDHSKVVNGNERSTFHGLYVGRDNVNGTGNGKQK